MEENFLVHIKDQFFDFVWDIGPTLIKAVVALIVGLILLRLIKRFVKKVLKKSHLETSLKTFISSLLSFILYGFLFAIVGIVLGIEATSFIAVFGAAGIAIGLALQGSLANFAGGVLILVFKPFRIGDLVHINETLGFVEQVDILYTRLKTFDGRIVTMPNGNVANSDVDNRTMNDIRRIDLHFKVSLEEDIEEIRAIILAAMKIHPEVLKDPEPDVWMDSIDDYAMNFYARSWCVSVDYYPMSWHQLENIKKALDKHGIKIQIPKQEFTEVNPVQKPKDN